ncbi:hypothetical protein [Peribacillus frigoritolerans]|uniref:hypothetical protein n=1 Tax=Peribacillus frigoritolerans TaxID=450367 RepID=UPI001D4BCE8C|nr:hypothetical protein [Listeria monocytogenes]
METIEKVLADGWKLIAHPDYTVYSNYKTFVVMTSEDDLALKFTVANDILKVDNTSWDTKIEISGDRTLTITNDPTYDEDED